MGSEPDQRDERDVHDPGWLTPIATVRVNQTISPSDVSYGGVLWKSLGTYYTSMAQLTLVLSSQANGNVVADAAMVSLPVSTTSGKTISASSTMVSKVVAPVTSGNPSVSVVAPDILSSTSGFTTFLSKLSMSSDSMPMAPALSTVSPMTMSTMSSSMSMSPAISTMSAPTPTSSSVLASTAPPQPVDPVVSVPEMPQVTVPLIPDDLWFIDAFFSTSATSLRRPNLRAV